MKMMKAVTVLVTISLFLIMAFTPLGVSRADTGALPLNPCSSTINAQYQGISRSAAISAAEDSPYFQDVPSSFVQPSFGSIFTSGFALPPTCDISDLTVNVVFLTHNSTGRANVIIAENASTLHPTSLEIQYNPPIDNYCSSTPCDNTVWAGYDVYANSGATNSIYLSSVDFNQSNAKYPPTGCNFDSGLCEVASWAGLEDEQGASPDGHIVQAGTDALCSGSSCSPTYDEWYEYGSTRTTCSGSIQAGDTISAEVYNDVISGGYNYQYGFTVSDSRSGLYCHADLLSYNSMLSPTYGMFITENEEYCTGTACASLAEFGTVHFYDAEIYTSSQYQYIYTFSSKGYDYQDVMQNAPISRFGCGPTYTTNASPGAISSPGTFYVHWKSSQNTPVWGNDNC